MDTFQWFLLLVGISTVGSLASWLFCPRPGDADFSLTPGLLQLFFYFGGLLVAGIAILKVGVGLWIVQSLVSLLLAAAIWFGTKNLIERYQERKWRKSHSTSAHQ